MVVGTALRSNPQYYRVYLVYLNLVLHGLVPLLALTTLNTAVYCKLREVSSAAAGSGRLQAREVSLVATGCG